MRITITLDDDVATRLERLRKDRSLKAIVNELLRIGLDAMEHKSSPPKATLELTIEERLKSLTPLRFVSRNVMHSPPRQKEQAGAGRETNFTIAIAVVGNKRTAEENC